MVHPKQAANANFLFQKAFGDSDFMAAGQLVIPPQGQKPTKGTKDNTFVCLISLLVQTNIKDGKYRFSILSKAQ